MLKRKRRLRRFRRSKRKLILPVLLVAILIYTGFSTFKKLTYHPPHTTSQTLAAHATKNPEPASLVLLRFMLQDKQINFTNITVSNSTYDVSLPDGSEVLFSGEKDINLQISSLQFILSRLTMEGRTFSRLDLRFDKPTIVLKK